MTRREEEENKNIKSVSYRDLKGSMVTSGIVECARAVLFSLPLYFMTNQIFPMFGTDWDLFLSDEDNRRISADVTRLQHFLHSFQ